MWRMPDTAARAIARWTVFALAGLMIVNLVKSRASPASLRRIGNLWDVITFWPRAFHPFAVRPYAERAVPELREFMRSGPRNSTLVVAAHSQGAVLAVRAPCSPARRPSSRRPSAWSRSVARWATCTAVLPPLFAAPARDAVKLRFGHRWRNVFRYTDHVGRAVFVDDAAALARYVDTPAGVARARRPPDRRPVADRPGAGRPQPLLGRNPRCAPP